MSSTNIIFIVLAALYLVYLIIATVLLIIDAKKAKQEERPVKTSYVVLFNISWGLLVVPLVILILGGILVGIAVLGM